MGRTGIGVVCLCLWTVGVVVRGQDEVNVATGKTYNQSSKHPSQGPSSTAANGKTGGIFSSDNCIHTAENDDLSPWWEVDLGRTYPVKNIRIWARTNNQRRLYPSTITVDGETCATVESFPDDTREKTVACSAVMYGQTVRITRNATGQISATAKTLNMCELQVLVPSEVSQCSAGSYGPSCGLKCNDHCGRGSDKNFCYKSSGDCYDGCVNGWYGAQCSTACSPGCPNGQCDEQTGQCAPCHDGYTGNKCTGCNSGYYKTNNDTCTGCSSNCQSQSCNSPTGRCNGCVNGYYGDTCDTMCPTPNCHRCHQDTGVCEQCNLNGHLQPPNCTGCVNGYYGDMCDTLCPTPNCRQCHKDTGECEQCNLNSHMLPPSCTGCVDGYYGDMCDTLCPTLNCQQCHQGTGECEQCTLNSHLMLPNCTECENGYYQINISMFDRFSSNCRSFHCVSSPGKSDDKTKTVIIGVLATLLVICICVIIILGVILCFRIRMSRKMSRHGNAEHEAVASTAATSPTTVTKPERRQATAGSPGAGQQDDEEHYEKVDDLPMSTRNVHLEPSALHDIKVQLPCANVANPYNHTAVQYQNTGDVHLYE